MIDEAIGKLADSCDLEPEVVIEVARDIMAGRTEDVQTAAFLTALRMKGETAEEIAAFARVMRENCERIAPAVEGTLVDTCGTGGDGVGTFNISTAAAFIVAGCGIPVAKHGNRSVSSRCGSADILEALGVRIDLEPEQVRGTIESAGIGFMYAPRFHPAMKNVQAVRRSLGIRTVFNILGPLTNPAGAEAQVIGAYSPEVARKVGAALSVLGTKKAMVVHGAGMDELNAAGENLVVEVDNGVITESWLSPAELGIRRSNISELVSDDIETSKRYFLEALAGTEGPRADAAALNAAAGIMVGGKAMTMEEGISMARECVASGNAVGAFERLKREAAVNEA